MQSWACRASLGLKGQVRDHLMLRAMTGVSESREGNGWLRVRVMVRECP